MEEEEEEVAVVVVVGGGGGREWRPADQAHSLVNHVDEMPC